MPTPTPPEDATNEFLVPCGQLTFDAEGMEERGRYFSRIAHVPSPSSGVTIGRGYDMSGRGQEKIFKDLTDAGIEEALAKKFAEASGLTGSRAEQFLKENNLLKIEITPKQQRSLFLIAYKELEEDVRRICNKREVRQQYGTFVWENLNPRIKEVLVDLRYRGDYSGITRTKIQRAVTENDLVTFTTIMCDQEYWVQQRNVPQDRFKRRRDFLQRV